MENNNSAKSKKKWPIIIALLLAYCLPFSWFLTYYSGEFMFVLTILWVAFLFFATLKTNNSYLIVPGHCLSFLISFSCSSHNFRSALDGPGCLPLSFLPYVMIVSLMLLIGHAIIAVAYKKIQAKKVNKSDK